MLTQSDFECLKYFQVHFKGEIIEAIIFGF